MSAKTILIAHGQAAVRERFAAALADARHAFVLASTDAEACRAAADRARPISLALVDLGLSDDGVGLVRAIRYASDHPVPVAVFAGSIASASQIPALIELEVSGYVSEHAVTQQILPALAPHLFPDSFDRRASARVPLGVPVSYRAGQTITGAHALNVSKGGIAVRTMTPLAARTAIHVKFTLPGQAGDVEASGRVTWSDRKVGMGIQFERVDEGALAAIDAFVERHRAADASSRRA